MLINVVNFLLFAHISFGIVRCLNLAAYRSFALLCRSLALLLSLFNEKFMTWPFSVVAVFVVAVVLPPAGLLLPSFDALLASQAAAFAAHATASAHTRTTPHKQIYCAHK